MSFPEAYERIKFATSTRTQVELAEVLEIRQSSISDAKRRNSVPAEWFMKLFDKFGVNPDWLKHGAGPMYLRTEKGYIPQDGPHAPDDISRFRDTSGKGVTATVYSMSCDVVEGSPPALLAVGSLSLPQPFVQENIRVFKMEAANMEPLLKAGAYIGVDERGSRPVSGKLYALSVPGEGIVIRRVFLNGEEECLLRSESSIFPEKRLPVSALPDRMLGRVTWVFQDL